MTATIAVEATPSPFRFELAHTAVVLIDMQRDFVEAGGFGVRWATTCPSCKPSSHPCGPSSPTPAPVASW